MWSKEEARPQGTEDCLLPARGAERDQHLKDNTRRLGGKRKRRLGTRMCPPISHRITILGDLPVYRSSQSSPRMAAVSSGTLFGITLAIVAGLVVAASVKLFILDQKPKPVPPPEMRELTVAAVNILDKMQIGAGQVKTIQVPLAKYQDWEKRARDNNTEMLIGKQPVNRTTVLPIPAEEPIFANQLEKMSYPEPVSNRLHDGMRAVIVEVPAHDAMVQVGDQVDVLCTMSADNATFGKGSTNTAALAKHAAVVARFGTTRTGAQAAPGDRTRSYTLEVTPYRFALIELAKSLGG